MENIIYVIIAQAIAGVVSIIIAFIRTEGVEECGESISNYWFGIGIGCIVCAATSYIFT